MSTLVFSLKSKPTFTLDMSSITPSVLEGLTLAKIKKLKLVYGKETVTVDSLFNVKGKYNDSIVIENSCNKLICVGKGLSKGTITVNGDVGDLLGQSMTKGSIQVNGNAGSWIGNKMSGGRIDILGNAGDFIGAGLPGDAFGMNKGLINIHGNAGDRVGDRMRRGIIIISGSAGDFCGSRMHAGTIIARSKVGKYPGSGMRRGTIILDRKPAHIAATFKSCGILKMQFLRLFFTQLAAMDKEFETFNKLGPTAHRYSGDLARNGKGELLILKSKTK